MDNFMDSLKFAWFLKPQFWIDVICIKFKGIQSA